MDKEKVKSKVRIYNAFTSVQEIWSIIEQAFKHGPVIDFKPELYFEKIGKRTFESWNPLIGAVNNGPEHLIMLFFEIFRQIELFEVCTKILF